MIRPEVILQLECPAVGLATSWAIGRKSVPCENLRVARNLFLRKYWPYPKGKIGKSAGKASKLRDEGNAAYKTAPNDPEKALQLYNQAICTAEDGSTELGLAYANRSAVFFNQKMYRECLANIELARRNHYPEDMMHKLTEREERCKELMENLGQSTENDTPRHCSIKSCLKLSEDSRGIFTQRTLKVGEKVLLEKPFVLVLEPEQAYQRCDYCGASNELNLFPCKGCTAVMYCSQECQEQSFQRYHQFECEIVDDLHMLFRGPKATRMFQLSLRLFWLAVLLYLEDPEQFLERATNPAELGKYRDPFGLEPTDYILHLLAVCRDKPPSSDHRQDRTSECISQFLTVIVYVVAVEENESLWSRLMGKQGNEMLLNILYRLIDFSKWTVEQHPFETVTVYYPFTRLLRTSCAPNAEKIIHGLQSVIVVKRPVFDGQELTIAEDEKLTIDYASKSKRAELRNKNRVTPLPECKCEGCKADYPELAAVPVNEALANELDMIRNETDDSVRERGLLDFMERHGGLYPSRELAEAWKTYRPFVTKDL